MRQRDAIEVACPACNAKANERCSQPTDTGRREVGWFHIKRAELVDAKWRNERTARAATYS